MDLVTHTPMLQGQVNVDRTWVLLSVSEASPAAGGRPSVWSVPVQKAGRRAEPAAWVSVTVAWANTSWPWKWS